jgi:hypothetical protein
MKKRPGDSIDFSEYPSYILNRLGLIEVKCEER